MASHQLTIAKASFAAALLRADPDPVARQQIAELHSSLDTAIAQCSPSNIQKCKRWIVQYIVHSQRRCSALGKYLVALSQSFKPKENSPVGVGLSKPSVKRKRLHIIYLIHDVFYHLFRLGNPPLLSTDAPLFAELRSSLPALFESTGSFENSPKHHSKLNTVLDLWLKNSFFTPVFIAELRERSRASRVSKQSLSTKDEGASSRNLEGPKLGQDAPFLVPTYHGEFSTPWYDLPAATLMPHIIPDPSAPINTRELKPLKLLAGPADATLITAVKCLLKDVNDIYQPYLHEDEGIMIDIDPMGQPAVRDKSTGELKKLEAYYGWSKDFCERTKNRRRRLGNLSDDGRGQSDDSSRTPSPHRERSSRYLALRNGSTGLQRLERSPRRESTGGYNDSKRHSPRPRFQRSPRSPRSHSASPPARRSRRSYRSRSRSRSRSHSRSSSRSNSISRSPYRHPRQSSQSRTRSRSPYRNRSRSGSRGPPDRLHPPARQMHLSASSPYPQPLSQQHPGQFTQASAPPPFPGQFGVGFPPVAGGLPLPPPPPPGGQWPLPPLPPHMLPASVTNQPYQQAAPYPPPPFPASSPYNLQSPTNWQGSVSHFGPSSAWQGQPPPPPPPPFVQVLPRDQGDYPNDYRPGLPAQQPQHGTGYDHDQLGGGKGRWRA